MALRFFSLLFIGFASSQTLACPNLTGDYHLVDNPSFVHLVVTQQACKTMTLQYSNAAGTQSMGKVYPMDHVRRKTFENESLLVYEVSGYRKDVAESFVDDVEKPSLKTLRSDVHMYLDSANDFHSDIDYRNYSGIIWQSKHLRFARDSLRPQDVRVP